MNENGPSVRKIYAKVFYHIVTFGILSSFPEEFACCEAVGTSMTEGTSLVQCSYVPTEDACSSPDFCTLVRGDRPKCFPKVGKNQNLEAGHIPSSMSEILTWESTRPCKMGETDYQVETGAIFQPSIVCYVQLFLGMLF